ncbi:Arginine utilization protein RocB [Dethiosulfatibacter aminovorans DSM 17477]|uniref:Arginine utilization protein RocB n=1 Tax=Dethiosulfatibacter aminovorans DSM 17477 TaxID=1121476 RepID=A0A1M6BVB8_9FIRM|nr:M20/M25/M40 family metallo-hydrolase [Dethiosulfatibacter aminovorans]SHI52726.1 Arginine utilization protein RocB [Dethiosulfatibacter aminovorans DSM 17477]
MDRYNRDVEKLMYELVAVQSDTGTAQELEVERFIYEWFSRLDYFKKNDRNFGYFHMKNDPFKRSAVWALVKGKGDETIILLNHHDVVDSFDYGELMEFAYKPAALKEKMAGMELNDEVKADLHDDDWIFGRGTADMKAGAAIEMKLVESFSEVDYFSGNVLFISVPDEENLSLGMRDAVLLLEDLKNEFSLDYKFTINTEPHNRDRQDEYVYFDGSVGKLLMSVYVKGKRTHMGEIFKGLNPSYVLSKIIDKTEMNTDFSDFSHGMVTPPPSWGFARDFKERYDVSVPEAAGGYIGFLTLESTPYEIMSELKNICKEACDEAYRDINRNFKRFNNIKESYDIKTRVLTYQELMSEALAYDDNLTNSVIEDKKKEIAGKINRGEITLAESNLLLIKSLLDIIPDKNPVVVLSISPPYYPHILKDNIDLKDRYLLDIDDNISGFLYKNTALDVKNKKAFMGISDGSYFDFQCGRGVGNYVKENMPLWGSLYSIPFEGMKNLGIPVINLGPWGKDIHKISERVNRIDLNETVPNLIRYIIEGYFKR